MIYKGKGVHNKMLQCCAPVEPGTGIALCWERFIYLVYLYVPFLSWLSS